MSSQFFPADFLEALSTWSQQRARRGWGSQKSQKPGRERAGFDRRHWNEGEGIQNVDWRASARSGERLVRLREREVGGELQIVLDRSASLQPGPTRRDADQRRLALAWGWLHLEGGGNLHLLSPKFDGKFSGGSARGNLMSELERLPPPSGEALPEFGPSTESVFMTDPWSKIPLRFPTQTTVLTLVLPQEDTPPASGLNLRDIESGETLEVSVDSSRFQKTWERFLNRRSQEINNAGANPVEFRLPTHEASAVDLITRLKGANLV
ncbi:MAG: DUF58 domain-containing protein [Planctomycetota bacterium]|nr:DUF58 domain-containing protein [Planctomycetota bacterium]